MHHASIHLSHIVHLRYGTGINSFPSSFPSLSSRVRWVEHTYLKQPESDQIAAWASGGAGLFTDGILQTVRDPTSLSAQR